MHKCPHCRQEVVSSWVSLANEVLVGPTLVLKVIEAVSLSLHRKKSLREGGVLRELQKWACSKVLVSLEGQISISLLLLLLLLVLGWVSSSVVLVGCPFGRVPCALRRLSVVVILFPLALLRVGSVGAFALVEVGRMLLVLGHWIEELRGIIDQTASGDLHHLEVGRQQRRIMRENVERLELERVNTDLSELWHQSKH